MIDVKKNLAKVVAKLTADRDILGNKIKVGSLVRSYERARLLDDGGVAGVEIDEIRPHDRVEYIEGRVVEIGTVVDGRPCYTVAASRRVRATRYAKVVDRSVRRYNYLPPVNGTLDTTGQKMFGVVVVEPPLTKAQIALVTERPPTVRSIH